MITFPSLARVFERGSDDAFDAVWGVYLINCPQDLHAVVEQHNLLRYWAPQVEAPPPSLDAYLRRVHKISEHELSELKPDSVWRNSRFSNYANNWGVFVAQQRRGYDKLRADADSETGKTAVASRLLNRLMAEMADGGVDAANEFKGVVDGNSILGWLRSSVQLEITEFDTIERNTGAEHDAS
jgi:hypothetical protein